MTAGIKNRYEFMFYVECVNGNPNGDPDMGNTPRIDPQDMHGYITDVAFKRRLRNYIQVAYNGNSGMNIIMQNATNLNRFIAEAHENIAVSENVKQKDKVYAARQWSCKNYYDVRTFGAVLSTGPNAGQVRGPVQFTFARSIDPILPIDITITRMLVTQDLKAGATSEDYKKFEDERDESVLRTMGRKQFIPYGLYEARGFISANLSEETGFNEFDLKVLFESILNMYEHDRSASKGQMSVLSPLILFKHVGTDTNEDQRTKQAKLGCAPAHKLFNLVSVKKKVEVKYPRSNMDYEARIHLSSKPSGVDIGFLNDPNGEISWNQLPDDSWLKANES